MKKNLFLVFVAISSFTTLANARFFLGIDGGYSMDSMDVSALYTERDEFDSSHGYTTKTIYEPFDAGRMYDGGGMAFDINLGTEHHFDENNYVGFRWFLSGEYGTTKLIDHYKFLGKSFPSTYYGIGLGMDLLLDVIKLNSNSSVGFFGGANVGYISFRSNNRIPCTEESTTCSFDGGDGGKPARYIDFGSFFFNARVGISVFLANHHRVEFVTEIPVAASSARTPTPIWSNDIEYSYKPLQFMLGYKFVF